MRDGVPLADDLIPDGPHVYHRDDYHHSGHFVEGHAHLVEDEELLRDSVTERATTQVFLV